MASRKPNLRIPLPVAEQGEFQRPSTSLRSPRFIEDFNAPFSEAVVNASRTTLATDTMTYPSTSTNSRASFGGESGRRTSFGTRQPSGMQSPTRLRLRHSSWESETKRRSTVNERIREWAKKSWGAVRNRSDSKGDYFEGNPNRSRSSQATSPSPDDVSPSPLDGPSRTGTSNEAPASRSG
ncbi:hypothetical protein B0J13DRAFT_615439 [Dactylonectria estremocensis]|uniref:Uncharacterized protein n=1 Tax=Dactylonectria estremocensis TaxID=1079267 RepID=A0A9P9FJ54_9HYPO|nr:hypothetical protein B0J13DRAFT_615439 [Dactylonectria estremocensis]